MAARVQPYIFASGKGSDHPAADKLLQVLRRRRMLPVVFQVVFAKDDKLAQTFLLEEPVQIAVFLGVTNEPKSLEVRMLLIVICEPLRTRDF